MSTDLALATGHGDVHETAGVCEPLLGAALGGLLLLLGLNLCSVSAGCPHPHSIHNQSVLLLRRRVIVVVIRRVAIGWRRGCIDE